MGEEVEELVRALEGACQFRAGTQSETDTDKLLRRAAASLTRVEEERDDLAMIIRRIAYRNNRDLPIEQTIVGALEYLTRKGLMGSPLRADDDGLSRTRGGAGD